MQQVIAQHAWYGTVQERDVMQRFVLSGEVTKTLGLKTGTQFMDLPKVWDSDTPRVVKGQEVKEILPREVIKKNKQLTGRPSHECVKSIEKVEVEREDRKVFRAISQQEVRQCWGMAQATVRYP